MVTHSFLSPEWVKAAREIQARHLAEAEGVPPPDGGLKMNLVVREVPFESGRTDAHLDTTSGEWILDLGHLEDSEVTVTLGYADAKAILVDRNGDVAMQAFFSGRIQVEGDMTKLLAFQGQQPSQLQVKMLEEIRDITG